MLSVAARERWKLLTALGALLLNTTLSGCGSQFKQSVPPNPYSIDGGPVNYAPGPEWKLSRETVMKQDQAALVSEAQARGTEL
jgi:hypothetical protein